MQFVLPGMKYHQFVQYGVLHIHSFGGFYRINAFVAGVCDNICIPNNPKGKFCPIWI